VSTLQFTDDQETALHQELASLRPKLEIRRAVSDAPSFASRQRIILRILKHVQALRTFANSGNKPEQNALQDICFAAGTFPEGFADRHGEDNDLTFVWRWFNQAESIEAIAKAALDRPMVGLLRGEHVAPYRQGLIGTILPGLFERIFDRKFPTTRKGTA
jgi:hypothetical protein